jgi:hypothetical protein
MKKFVFFVATLVYFVVTVTGNPGGPLINFEAFAQHRGLSEADKTKFAPEFAQLKDAFCKPETMDEDKIKKVMSCGHPRRSNESRDSNVEKCRNKIRGDKSLNDLRKEACAGNIQIHNERHQNFIACMKESNQVPPLMEPQTTRQPKEDRSAKLIEMKNCFEKALA